MTGPTEIMRRMRRVLKPLAAILAASFLLHLSVALLSSRGIVQDDADSYRTIALNLAHGNGYVFAPGKPPTAWRAPTYPVFLAAIFKLTGDSLVAARIANAFLWLGADLSVAVIAFAFLDPPAALLACALTAFYPEFLGFSGLVWSESLSIFLFVCALALLVLLGASRRWPLALLAGLCCGVLILSRTTFLVLLFVVLVAGFAGLLKRSQAVATVLVALAVVAPWTVRNERLLHHFVLVESNATQNLYKGSRPDLPILFPVLAMEKTTRNDPVYTAIAKLPPSAQYAAFGAAARKNILAHPIHFALIGIGKTLDFWWPDYFIARNVRAGSFDPQFDRGWVLVLAVTATAFLIVALGALCTLIRFRRQRIVQIAMLLIVVYTLPHSLTHGSSRYHVPLLPILCILAAPALLDLVRRLCPRSTSTVV